MKNKTNILRVYHNSFTNKETGEVIEYAGLDILVPVNSDKEVGHKVEHLNFKAKYYQSLVDIYSKGQPVELETELVQVDDKGTNKKKLISVNDLKVNA